MKKIYVFLKKTTVKPVVKIVLVAFAALVLYNMITWLKLDIQVSGLVVAIMAVFVPFVLKKKKVS